MWMTALQTTNKGSGETKGGTITDRAPAFADDFMNPPTCQSARPKAAINKRIPKVKIRLVMCRQWYLIAATFDLPDSPPQVIQNFFLGSFRCGP
jgi:hypothetical protein